MATLIVVGKRSTSEHPITQSVTVIGRDAGANLELGDLQVSRRHALLVSATQGYFVKDLGSRNGILLNQQKVPTRQQARLKNGDVINLGRTTLIFKDLVGGDESPERTTRGGLLPAPPRRDDDDDGDDDELGQEARRTPVSVDIIPATEKDTPDLVPVPAEAISDKTPESLPVARSQPREGAPAPSPKPAPADPARNIPRARAPKAPAPVYSGQAEVLTLRALMERAERDRVFYRNLALILFCLLIGTLVLLFAWIIAKRAQGEPKTSHKIEKTQAAPAAPKVATVGAVRGVAARLDHGVFAKQIQPILSAKCAQCHSAEGGGNLLLAGGTDAGTIEANLAAVARFVVPGQPKQSSLLLKAAGEAHGGGATLATASSEWKTLQAWVANPQRGRPPRARIAAPAKAELGKPIRLDGKESVDPDGETLSFRWSLVETPDRSRARLKGVGSQAAELTPDRAGRYVVALVVHDGSASGSTTHQIEVAGAAAAPAAPVAASRTKALERACRALLGRAPTAAEGKRLAKLHGRELHAFFLEQDALYTRWWERELSYLGLGGKHRPRGEPWDSLPGKLKAGQYSVADVHYALVVGQSWQDRYAGKEAYVDALLEKLLGPSRAKDTTLRTAGQQLYDGYQATLLGETAKGQIGLVRVVVRSAVAHRFLLERSYRALTKRAPAEELIKASLKRFEKDPGSFFRQLVEWASPI